MSDFICSVYSVLGGDYTACREALGAKKVDTPVGAGCASSRVEASADQILFLDSSPELEIAAADMETGRADEPVLEIPGAAKDVPTTACQDGNPSASLQISWLKNQIGKNGLVDSYKDDGTDRAYLYDQAVAAIAFTQSGETCEAQQVFKTLSILQKPNGSWNTCYSAGDGSVCEAYIHTGPIAWVVMAVNFYEAKTGDKQFSPMADKALNWLDNTIVNFGEAKGALRYGEGEAKISTEHNLDAYSAYYYRGKTEEAAQIKGFLVSEMWAPSSTSNGPYHNVSVFWRGYNDFAWCTDPQSWGVLALGSDYAKALEWLDLDGYGYGSTKNTKQGVTGFSFCTEDDNVCGKAPFVWLEGTEGVAAAYYFIGDSAKGDYYHNQTKKLVGYSGGVPHIIGDVGEAVTWPCNFPYESVASTAWYYFNEVKVNPFKPF